ncbi:MAG: peptidylprolyl isomerase [Dysosmobacter sp.]
MSDAEKAEKKAKADDLLKQLQAITDPTELESKFDELMKANSEDTGLESSPDGYVFSAGKMVEAFESATRSLEPGQLSGIVESDYGYHIILRLDPATSKAFRENYSSEKLREMEKQWVDEADIKTTETYDNLSVADFYDKLTAYRDSLNTDADQAEEENQQVEQDTGDENAADSNTDADANADAQTDSADADKPDASNAADTTDTQDTGDSASQAQQ